MELNGFFVNFFLKTKIFFQKTIEIFDKLCYNVLSDLVEIYKLRR